MEINVPTIISTLLAFGGLLISSWWWLLRRFVDDLSKKDEEVAASLDKLSAQVEKRHQALESRLNQHIEKLPTLYVLRTEVERRLQEQSEGIATIRAYLEAQEGQVTTFYREFAGVLEWARRQMERA